MKALMISTDKTLLGEQGIGDAEKRHQQYAAQVERLDIVVLSKNKLKPRQLTENSTVSSAQYWKSQSLVEKLFENNKYDLVICQDPFLTGSLGAYIKKKYNSKLIIHFHGDFFDNQYWLKEKYRHRVYKKLAEKNIYFADSIRVVSNGIRQKLLKRGIAKQDIYTISTPVNLERFKIQDLGCHFENKIVITVGRIVKAKDFPTLIKAAELVSKKVPGFEWHIAGDGELLKKFKKQTKNQSYIKWLGLVDHQQLSAYYQRAAVVAMTSNNESFGKVFLEAAMAKTPAVATNTVGAREIIEDGKTGYIVPIGDYKAVAERIVYLLQQPHVAKQMGELAFQSVQEKFGWDKNINLIINMWKQTVGGK